MTEEDAMFDLTMKKKKKKKKVPFDLDAALGGDEAGDAPAETVTESGNNREETENINNVSKEAPIDDDSLDFSMMKKKKKKKTPFDMAQLEEVLPAKEESKETEAPVEQEAEVPVMDGNEEDLSFDFSQKKKKKKKVKIEEAFDDGEDKSGGKDDGGAPASGKEESSWSQSDRDYTYDELLGRVFDIMREKNPEMVAGEKKRFVMKPPQVMRAGTKKTAFSNFSEISRMLHRQPKHLLAFLLAELGTSGSLDGSNQLIIKGRFQQKQIENVLRRYIKEYVTCHTCRSPDTMLQRDTRLYFLQCETCGSRCSVASIKSGFQAVTSKRAALRAKTT